MHIALFEPEIPPNTGNIARLCVGLEASLSIIGKPAFDLSEKAVKRAGLDYWEHLNLTTYENWETFLETITKEKIFLITKFGKTRYSDVIFQNDVCLVFGKETTGIPKNILESFPENQKLFIPMPGKVRSLNLSNAVAVVAYEAFRQFYK
ncbi:MAG: tRNA (cytidine(34)-2'-O)-methyltransferase [Spirochaetia bacterium]|nr:tRNA (cytidine(34)-2'-O)-methyltransferase [Spirochaetia bacterium]